MVMKFSDFFRFMSLLSIAVQLTVVSPNTHLILEKIKPNSIIVNLRKKFSISQHTSSIPQIYNNGEPGIEYFMINPKTLDLVVKTPPDRDKICSNKQSRCIVPLLILHGKPSAATYSTVNIEIVDINDHTPTFPQNKLIISIPENTDNHANLMDRYQLPEAIDQDTKENGVNEYKLEGQDSVIFKVIMDSEGPKLGLIEKLDRETKESYQFRLLAIDGGSTRNTGTLTVFVKVTDINDNKPQFTRSEYKLNLDEDISVDSTVLVLQALDSDSGDNGRVEYRIFKPNRQEERLAQKYFKITPYNSTACLLKVATRIDCRSLPNENLIEFFIQATDKGTNPKKTSALIKVHVNDINNNAPEITVQYLSHPTKNHNNLHKNHGVLIENHSQAMVAHVTVKDVDRTIGNQISCHTNDTRFHLNKISSDFTYNSQILYRKHAISMYKISNNAVIDREQTNSINFLLICIDNIHQRPSNRYKNQRLINDIIQLTSTQLITVDILDENDEKPIFSNQKFGRNNFQFMLPENLPSQSMVDIGKSYKLGYLLAKDNDSGENGRVEYSILSNDKDRFKIDRWTGALYAVAPYDREHTQSVTLTVQAHDCPKTGKRKSAAVEVEITITDANDNSPMFKQSSYNFEVTENIGHGIIGQVEATDDDIGDNALIQYQLKSVSEGDEGRINSHSQFSYFYVETSTGHIRLRKRLDRERQRQYVLVIQAIDSPGMNKHQIVSPHRRNSASVHVTIAVLDQNDNAPVISNPPNNHEVYIDPAQSSAGQELFTVVAKDPDYGANSTVRYEIKYGDTSLFDLGTSSGVCYLREGLTSQHPRSFTLQVRAYDLGTPLSLNSSVSIRIVRSNTAGRTYGDYDNTDPNSIDNDYNDHNSLNKNPNNYNYRSGIFNSISVSDRTLVVILATIFILLILITTLLVAFIRYRRSFWGRIMKKSIPPNSNEYAQGTVLQNYGNNKLAVEDMDDNRLFPDTEKYHNIFPGASMNLDKQQSMDSRRNIGYTEYGTLIHAQKPGQTFFNPQTMSPNPEYQPLYLSPSHEAPHPQNMGPSDAPSYHQVLINTPLTLRQASSTLAPSPTPSPRLDIHVITNTQLNNAPNQQNSESNTENSDNKNTQYRELQFSNNNNLNNPTVTTKKSNNPPSLIMKNLKYSTSSTSNIPSSFNFVENSPKKQHGSFV